MILLSSKYWFPSASHWWVYMFSAMMFTEYSATCPSGNSTSYIWVSRIGLGCSVPLREPDFVPYWQLYFSTNMAIIGVRTNIIKCLVLGICSLVIVLIHILCRSVHIWHIRIIIEVVSRVICFAEHFVDILIQCLIFCLHVLTFVFVVCQRSNHGVIDHLPILLEDLPGASLPVQSQVVTQNHIVFWERDGCIPKHNPFMPAK